MANSTPLHISPTPRLFLHGCPVLFPVGLENGQHNISSAEHLITLHSEHSSLFFLLQSMALHFSPSPSSAPLYIGLNNLILDWRRQIHKFTLLIWSVRLQQSELIVQPKFEPTKKKKKHTHNISQKLEFCHQLITFLFKQKPIPCPSPNPIWLSSFHGTQKQTFWRIFWLSFSMYSQWIEI